MPALTINNQNGTVVDGQTFTTPVMSYPDGVSILITNSTNITVQNCNFHDCGWYAVSIENCSNVTVRNNTFIRIHGATWAGSCPNGGIVIQDNRIDDQRLGNENTGGCIQFVTTKGAGNKVTGNVLTNFSTSKTEDCISLAVDSEGTSASPFLVDHNSVFGVTTNPSGSGINVGDNAGQWITVSNNRTKDAGAGGIGVSGGFNIVVTLNQVLQTGRPGVNGSIVVKDFSGGGCSNITVSNNQVDYHNASGQKVNGWSGTIWSDGTDGCGINQTTMLDNGNDWLADLTNLQPYTIGQAPTITTSLSTSFRSELATALHNFTTTSGNVFKAALIKSGFAGTYGASTTNYSAITSNSDEVVGTGYTAGGFAWTAAQNVTPATTSTTAYWSWSVNASWTSASFSAAGAMIYNSTNGNRSVAVFDFGGTVTVNSGTFTVVLPTNNSTSAVLRII